MASNDVIRRKARSDYIYRRLNGATISAAHGVSEATFGRWKKKAKAGGDDWDIARSASVMAGEGSEVVMSAVLEDYMIMAQSLMEKIKVEGTPVREAIDMMVSLADATAKMAAAAGRLAPKVSELGVAQRVMRVMIDFVREEYPQHLSIMQELLEHFGDHVSVTFAP